ncbi:MAG TPA: hypothetical protein VEA16_18295, partial [Vicinamibacterales bacterium]|nr:hypothetical protein [Vicinamibacterales bacterium]
AMAALRELTGWKVEPYLVCDELLDTMATEYGRQPEVASAPAAQTAPRDVADVAAHVAGIAKVSKSVWVSQARCDPYLWVRLQGPANVEDLLVPVEDEEEEPCLALPMSR